MAVKKGKREPVDISMLSEADLERIQKKAKAEVLAERKKVAEASLLEDLIQEEKAQYDVAEEETVLTINLPAYATHLLIDGVTYNHGDAVTVTRRAEASIREQMGRMWAHESESGNPNMRDYKPVKEDSFSAASVGFGRV